VDFGLVSGKKLKERKKGCCVSPCPQNIGTLQFRRACVTQGTFVVAPLPPNVLYELKSYFPGRKSENIHPPRKHEPQSV
jgi:hypothetical protein